MRGGMASLDMHEDQVFQFVAASIPSVWALETLLLLKRVAPETRRTDELVLALRSSELAIAQGLARLEQAGLIGQCDGLYRYHPASPALAGLADDVERLYASRPLSLVNIIMRAKNNLQIFADSFKITD